MNAFGGDAFSCFVVGIGWGRSLGKKETGQEGSVCSKAYHEHHKNVRRRQGPGSGSPVYHSKIRVCFNLPQDLLSFACAETLDSTMVCAQVSAASDKCQIVCGCWPAPLCGVLLTSHGASLNRADIFRRSLMTRRCGPASQACLRPNPGNVSLHTPRRTTKHAAMAYTSGTTTMTCRRMLMFR